MPIFTTLGAACAKAWGFTSGLITDQYFNLVSLLLPGNGTNGAQNNTFLDSSSNTFTITRNGNTTQGTFSPFSQTGWGNYFNGSNAYLTAGSASNWAFLHNGSDFTIECFVYHTTTSAVTIAGTTGTASQIGFSFTINDAGANVANISFVRGVGGSFANFSSNAVVQPNRWNYLAFTFTSATKTGAWYINGVAEGSTTNTSFAYSASNPSNTLAVGAVISSGTPGAYLSGYQSNLRISNNVRTGLTTVPTSPFTNDVNTALLTCQSNRFRDASTNGYTITVNGSPSVVPFSPFAPTQSYSASAVGGSGYFDGTGDYLSAPANAAFQLNSSAFTIEAWVYFTTVSGLQNIVNTWGGATTGWSVQLESSTIRFNATGDGADIIGTQTISANTWTHIAVSGTAGSSIKLFINGVQDGSTYTGNITDASTALLIGQIASSNYLNGYVSNLRIVKGTAVYTSNFTPPTAPLTAITNTSILLNFTNGGVVDATAKNVLETVGNAQISTTQSKWGGGSIYLDGTGDYLPTPASSLYAFRTGDFTIEFWIYPNNVSAAANQGMIQTSTTAGGLSTTLTNGVFLAFGQGATAGVGNDGGVYARIANNHLGGNAAAVTGSWQHIALCRASGTARLFVNGTQIASISNSSDVTGNYIAVGGYYSTSTLLNGYLDDVRITNFARYTANFTAPTAPFPVQ